MSALFIIYLTMRLSPESLAELKRLCKELGRDLTDVETLDVGVRLLTIGEALMHAERNKRKHEARLKKEPDGFIANNFLCQICCGSSLRNTIWFTKYGLVCEWCFAAFKDGTLPYFVATNRGSWFNTSDLERDYDISEKDVLQHIRKGELKARVVKNGKGRPHEYVFLRKENP